jgi:cobalt-zinc-cadmium efflux system membrane fusion protein
VLTNIFVFVLFAAASVLTGPATKVVTELMARGAVEQDEGVARPVPTPQAPASPTQTQIVAPIVPVLATATLVTPAPADPAPVVPPTPAAVRRVALEINSAEPSAASSNRADTNPSTTLLALTGDTPTRRADGSVFLPITMQRMVGMRTEITQSGEFAATEEIAGRIVTNRNVGALIQATQAGVIEPADGDVPRVGMLVTPGQLLAYQHPVIDATQQVEINAKIADLKGMIDMGEQRIARLREVYLIRYRQSKIDAVAAEVDNYRRQLAIYQSLTSARVEIRAQTNGVISRVDFVAGQIVQPQTTLFEIVDPTRLWVEAASFDPALAGDIASASAVTSDGRMLPLHFTGGGLLLQNQAVPLQFDILGDVSNLQVGKPVTVIVQRQHSLSAGIKLPRAAVLHSATGETMVWQRLSAEDFIARPVNMMSLDGDNVVITSGLTANMRVVTAAGEALSQVR